MTSPNHNSEEKDVLSNREQHYLKLNSLRI